MKKFSLISIIFAALLSMNPLVLHAKVYHRWAMAVMERGIETPTLLQYHSDVETAENGIKYYRIFDDSSLFHYGELYNPVKLQYGYRWGDKQLYIYDFDSQQETLALDFSLSPGDHFTTFNGIEWTVKAVKDTLVNISSECEQGEAVSKRLLTVSTADGRMTDLWLEDFGSFTDFFMINDLENVVCSQSLWMEYDYGEYLAREINADPIYTHDTGWLDAVYDDSENENNYTQCYIDDGNVIFENIFLCYEHRQYSLYYRSGDDIYHVYSWEMEPHIDDGTLALRKDVVTFMGLPVPASGKYTIHIGDKEYEASSVNEILSSTQSEDLFYDLQGRRLDSKPTQGFYIRNGEKVYIK